MLLAMAQEAYDLLLDYLRETATLESCLRVLNWDQETNMPVAGAELRARQVSLLAGMIHRRRNAAEFGDLIERAEPGDPAAAANVSVAKREHDRAVRVPAELMEERAHVTTLARRIWVDARKKDDFPLFRPWLEKVVDISRRHADALGFEDHPYDALLDIYEPGETRASVERLFGPLRVALAGLLARIVDSGAEVDDSILRRSYPIAAQERVGRRAAESIAK